MSGLYHYIWQEEKYVNHDILLPDRTNTGESRDMLYLVRANWFDAQSITLIRLFKIYGHNSYFVQFPNKFHGHSAWRKTHVIAFSACLFGTMVFPKDEGNEMNTRVVMVVDSIFREIGKKWEEKKYCSLAPIILADIYRSLCLCKNGFRFSKVAKFYFNGGWFSITAKGTVPSNKSWQSQARWFPSIIMNSN